MHDTTVLRDGTYAVHFRSPNSPNSELVFGQRAIRLRAFLEHYGSRSINILVNYCTTGTVPHGRYLDEQVNNGQRVLALRMNSLDSNPYHIDPVTAEKIANTIANNGVEHTIALLNNCREAVYQPIYLHDRGASSVGRPMPGDANYLD